MSPRLRLWLWVWAWSGSLLDQVKPLQVPLLPPFPPFIWRSWIIIGFHRLVIHGVVCTCWSSSTEPPETWIIAMFPMFSAVMQRTQMSCLEVFLGHLSLQGWIVVQKIWNCLKTVLSKFSNSFKSMRYNSFMNKNQKKLLYQIMGNICICLSLRNACLILSSTENVTSKLPVTSKTVCSVTKSAG